MTRAQESEVVTTDVIAVRAFCTNDWRIGLRFEGKQARHLKQHLALRYLLT